MSKKTFDKELNDSLHTIRNIVSRKNQEMKKALDKTKTLKFFLNDKEKNDKYNATLDTIIKILEEASE